MTKYHKKEDGNEIRKALGMYLYIYLPMFHSHYSDICNI